MHLTTNNNISSFLMFPYSSSMCAIWDFTNGTKQYIGFVSINIDHPLFAKSINEASDLLGKEIIYAKNYLDCIEDNVSENLWWFGFFCTDFDIAVNQVKELTDNLESIQQ